MSVIDRTAVVLQMGREQEGERWRERNREREEERERETERLDQITDVQSAEQVGTQGIGGGL